MLKYKKHYSATIADGAEPLTVMLTGMSGKNRRLVSLIGERVNHLYFRVYRDGEQMIDINSRMVTAESPILPCDIPLSEGQQLNVGYYNNMATSANDVEIVIGYEESD